MFDFALQVIGCIDRCHISMTAPANAKKIVAIVNGGHLLYFKQLSMMLNDSHPGNGRHPRLPIVTQKREDQIDIR